MHDFITNNHNAPCFEGWYYKMVTAAKDQCVVLIPGMSCPESKQGNCFIQVGQWPDVGSTKVVTYPITTVWAEDEGQKICIGDSCFTPTNISVDIKDGDKKVTGHVQFNNSSTPKKHIMGPFQHMPKMQCSHSIISMDSELSGQLIINDQVVDFTGGKGYIEKDWGKDFPKKHLWIQSNHFDKDIKSFTCAIADVPTPVGGMQGFFCILVTNDDKEHRFATYNGGKVNVMAVKDHDIHVEISGHGKRLRIDAHGQDGVVLDAPEQGDMVRKLTEKLGARVTVELWDSKTNTIIASGTGDMAGVEAEGIRQ